MRVATYTINDTSHRYLIAEEESVVLANILCSRYAAECPINQDDSLEARAGRWLRICLGRSLGDQGAPVLIARGLGLEIAHRGRDMEAYNFRSHVDLYVDGDDVVVGAALVVNTDGAPLRITAGEREGEVVSYPPLECCIVNTAYPLANFDPPYEEVEAAEWEPLLTRTELPGDLLDFQYTPLSGR